MTWTLSHRGLFDSGYEPNLTHCKMMSTTTLWLYKYCGIFLWAFKATDGHKLLKKLGLALAE